MGLAWGELRGELRFCRCGAVTTEWEMHPCPLASEEVDMDDITWKTATTTQVVACPAHGDRNTVRVCAVCAGDARVAARRVAAARDFLAAHDRFLVDVSEPNAYAMRDAADALRRVL